jgi:16S rRNA (guanine527-N7)-methyltransferase
MNTLDMTLNRGIEALGLTLAAPQVATLERYLDLLEKWNRVYNLTAIRDRAQMLTHHLLDSLAVVPFVHGPHVLDVGTGGGLPGIPVAIACPDLHVTLLDSNHKKTAFLNQAAAELPLPNVTVSAERIEAWDTPQRFATIVSRAFSDLTEFVTASARMLADGGRFVAMKGVHPFEEIERLPAAFVVNEVVRLQVPGLDAERHLVIVCRA